MSIQTKALLPFLLFLVVAPVILVAIIGIPSLRALDDTQRKLIAAEGAAILISAAIAWCFVRHQARFLRQLRDTTERVGRGDFSRLITVASNDECGDLAEAFNQMTADLQKSRLKLEKAAESLEETQAQLIQSEKLSAVGQFVAGVAHELNNPLALVIGFSELLVEKQTEPGIHSHLEIIAKNAHRCHKIVDNLLGFARQHKPDRIQTKITGTIDDVVEIMAYDLKTSNIDLIKDYHGSMPPIIADPHQLQQVFVNLLGNARQAIQAFRPDGQIIVRVRARDGFVYVEIADNGPGISAENIRRIFDPFFTTKPVGKGTGLGLSLTLGIIQEHAGRISVESEPGHGATFTVELPIVAEPGRWGREEALAPNRPRMPLGVAGSSGKLILVVDDEEWILTLARELLGPIGHAVQAALGGEAAIAAIEGRAIDAIVCDWKMPGMNGIQFYEHLLSAKPQLAHRILFTSGDGVDESFQAFLRSSERPFLPKPFSIQDFRDAVEKLLSMPVNPAPTHA